MVSGEIPVELGNSWISLKCVEAQRLIVFVSGKATVFMRAKKFVPNNGKLKILANDSLTSETVGDKLNSQKGNSPDRQLRSKNYA